MADVISDNLRLNLIDPAINVITALLIENVTVCIKQLLSLGSSCLLELLPLTYQLIQPWLNLLHSIRQTNQQSVTKYNKKPTCR